MPRRHHGAACAGNPARIRHLGRDDTMSKRIRHNVESRKRVFRAKRRARIAEKQMGIQ